MYRFNRVLFSTATCLVPERFSHDFTTFVSSVGQKVLPPELSRNVVGLTYKSKDKIHACHVYLIGTFHHYPKSVEDVRALVKFLKPQAVFLELCSRRAAYVYQPEEVVGTRNRLIKKVHDKFRVESEFQAAFTEANMYGATVFLGDRPLEISRRRYKHKFARMSFLQIMKTGLYMPLPQFSSTQINPYDILPTKTNLYNMPTVLLNELRQIKCPLYNEIYVDELDQWSNFSCHQRRKSSITE